LNNGQFCIAHHPDTTHFLSSYLQYIQHFYCVVWWDQSSILGKCNIHEGNSCCRVYNVMLQQPDKLLRCRWCAFSHRWAWRDKAKSWSSGSEHYSKL